MDWKSHLLFGTLISLIFAIFIHYQFNWFPLTPIILAQAIFIILITPLSADLDHQMGKLHSLLLGTGLIIATIGIGYWFIVEKTTFNIGNQWIQMIVAGVLLALSVFLTAKFAKHRGFMHSIPFCITVGAIFFILTGFNIQMGALAFVGGSSHLALDKIPFKMK